VRCSVSKTRRAEGRFPVSKPIRFGLVGVGNCASALIQGLTFYSRCQEAGPVANGLVFEGSSSISVRDMVPVCAFDADRRKVGIDLARAILHPVNAVERFCPDIGAIGVQVERGVLPDGCAPTSSTLEAGIEPEDRQPPGHALPPLSDERIGPSGVEVIQLQTGSCTPGYTTCSVGQRVHVILSSFKIQYRPCCYYADRNVPDFLNRKRCRATSELQRELK